MTKKLKGKEWYSLIAPKMFGEKVIGETPAGDPQTLKNRKIETSAANVIDDMSKYYMKLEFRIIDVKGNKAFTEFAGMNVMRDYISRMIRHYVSRIDTIQKLKTKDEKDIIIKTITITNKRIKKSVDGSLRKFIEDEMKKHVESNKLDDLIKMFIDDTIKNSILDGGTKIYPLRFFEVRKVVYKNLLD